MHRSIEAKGNRENNKIGAARIIKITPPGPKGMVNRL